MHEDLCNNILRLFVEPKLLTFYKNAKKTCNFKISLNNSKTVGVF